MINSNRDTIDTLDTFDTTLKTKTFRILTVLLVVLHFGLLVTSMWNSSAASDEPDYVGAGRYIVETGNWKFTSVQWHPPLTMYLNSIPLFFTDLPVKNWDVVPPQKEGSEGWVWYDAQIGEKLLFSEPQTPLRILRLARIPTIILSCLLLLVITNWTQVLFDKRAAILAGVLFAFSPNFLAHGRFAHTDTGFALFLTSQFWALWNYRQSSKTTWFAAAVLFAGATLGSKLNGLFSIPVALFLLLIITLGRKKSLWTFVKLASVYSLGSFLILWALYGFDVGHPREPGQLGAILSIFTEKLPGPISTLLVRVAESPLPFPQYFRLIASIVAYSTRGVTAFLFGEISHTGWWYYFPVAFLVKTPVPTILLMALGVYWNLKNYRTQHWTLYLWLPIFMIVVPAMNTSINIGVRHIMPAFTFLIILAGGGASAVLKKFPKAGFPYLLLIWLIVSTFIQHPHHLSYFNCIAGGTEGGEKILSDSNIDFGEDFVRLAQWQKNNKIENLSLAYFVPYDPSFYGVRFSELKGPTKGYVAVQVMEQQLGRILEPERFLWLDQLEPVERVGGSIKIYFIDEN